MKLSQSRLNVIPRFDDPRLIGYAGLIPVMRLAQDAGLHRLASELIDVPTDKGANPGAKIASLIAGMVSGGDSIRDMDAIRHGGMDRVFTDWRAPSTLGSFLRAFTFGHARQVDALGSRFLLGLDHHSSVFGPHDDGAPVMVDIDDTIVEVHSHHKQGARIGYTKTLGLNALLVTASSTRFAPVIIADRLRKGSANSARGACSLLGQGLATLTRSSLSTRQLWVRADSGFYGHQITAHTIKAGAWLSVTAPLNASVRRAIATIDQQAWTTITYPDPIKDDTTGEWVHRAQVAETTYTAFAAQDRHHKGHTKGITARLVVRRIPNMAPNPEQDPLFTHWRYHAIFTTVPTTAHTAVSVDKYHRGHAIIEQVNSALKDSALAHLPLNKFAANTVWLSLACMAFNLGRAYATLTENPLFGVATPATIRRTLIFVPARITTTARRVIVHLPENWKWATSWMTAFTATHRLLPA